MIVVGKAVGGGSSAVAASAHAACARFRGTDPLVTGVTRRGLAKQVGFTDDFGGIPEARWMRVRLVDDRSAYIQKGDLSFDLANISIDQMIELSKRFMGLPYTWGGTSSFGYDCSGFTQMLCRRRGIAMPRDAGPQANWSGVTAIDKKDLQKGDLLFFGPTAAKITHTGMYIGNGEFIHATANDEPKIQISKLTEPHWTRLLVATRRPK